MPAGRGNLLDKFPRSELGGKSLAAQGAGAEEQAVLAVGPSRCVSNLGWVEARFFALISAYIWDTMLPVLLPTPPWLEI